MHLVMPVIMLIAGKKLQENIYVLRIIRMQFLFVRVDMTILENF